MIEAAPEDLAAARELEVRGRDYYVYAAHGGIFEPEVGLGEAVAAGQLCGSVWDLEDIVDAPRAHCFSRAGIVMCLRHSGLVRKGDFLAHLATEVAP